MTASYPSIFNDVLGPVMRGPSSSHCAASLRIGRLCRDLMDGNLKDIHIEYDTEGSLAATHKGQGSDMGIFGGFLGWEAFDARLPESEAHLESAGITVLIEIRDIGATHPNTYQITLRNPVETRKLIAISTGGGMIEVIEVDGASVSMAGDFFEILVYCDAFSETLMKYIERSIDHEHIIPHEGPLPFVEIKARQFPSEAVFEDLAAIEGVGCIKKLHPVLPVLSSREIKVPFITVEEMLAFNHGKSLQLWELAVAYESARGNIPAEQVLLQMKQIVEIMRAAIDTGLKGTSYEDRILGPQSGSFQRQMKGGGLIEGDVLNRIILYVSAIMEVKSSMGVIVAAPTAGSCGALPGAVIGMAESLGLSEDLVVKAMLAAGLIGVFIAAHATFAAEVGGCQAECGSGACMGAAAMVFMAGGGLKQSLSAASLALQNSLGMICDPIANRVEAPCLGKNVLAATNALSSSNMALANYNHLIPLDEVIGAMKEVGQKMSTDLKCTTRGGLSITKTAKELEAKLEAKQPFKSC